MWKKPFGKAILAASGWIGKEFDPAASWAAKALREKRFTSWYIKTPLGRIMRRR